MDTVPTFDSSLTRDLVTRTIAASNDPPADLVDYTARVQSSLYLTLAPDSSGGGDLPASVDELVSEVRWKRDGFLHQRVLGHRTRMIIPLPYSLASLVEEPWVIPHLYGGEIYTPFAGPRAVNPFGARGPDYYAYTALDTVRITLRARTVTLVPVSVRPREGVDARGHLLVLGTFYIDVDRAAVARARFGFLGEPGDLPPTLGRLETYFELENALWDDRYWLPYRQRRDVVFESRVLGGAVAARVVNQFMSYDFNTGWNPTGERVQLTWDLEPGSEAFADWRQPVGEEAGELSIADFADLALATAAAEGPSSGAPRVQLDFERGGHLLRYNRVEGLYLGVGARLVPPDTRFQRWEVYGTGGWAFAEGTPRGELQVTLGSAVAAPATPVDGFDWGAEAAAYRRLDVIRPFRPTYSWDWLYTFPALFWGSDPRDYYDAAGFEAFGLLSNGSWDASLGARIERQDSVGVNTTHFLFGVADEFGPLAGAEPGTHVGIEATTGYTLGPGAFGIGNSLVARVRGEIGVGDFVYRRVTGLVSTRRALGPFTVAARIDGGRVWGAPPPQKLFRFGSTEGLRGYEPNEFGGSTALLARGRFLVGIPPRSARPLARIGLFLIPPLRPSLVLVGETGWTSVDDSLGDELARLRAVPTDGARSSVGLGVSFFDDAITIERLEPVGANSASRKGRWYAGLTYWY